ILVKQRGSPAIHHEQIQITIRVIVRRGDLQAGAAETNSGRCCRIFECAILVVQVKLIPMIEIDDIQILVSVIVEVRGNHATSLAVERNPGAGGDLCESESAQILEQQIGSAVPNDV